MLTNAIFLESQLGGLMKAGKFSGLHYEEIEKLDGNLWVFFSFAIEDLSSQASHREINWLSRIPFFQPAKLLFNYSTRWKAESNSLAWDLSSATFSGNPIFLFLPLYLDLICALFLLLSTWERGWERRMKIVSQKTAPQTHKQSKINTWWCLRIFFPTIL